MTKNRIAPRLMASLDMAQRFIPDEAERHDWAIRNAVYSCALLAAVRHGHNHRAQQDIARRAEESANL